MSLNEEDKYNLIQYRIEKSNMSKLSAEILLDKEEFFGTVNRIYYANFYMLNALALKFNFETKNHGKLIGWSHKEFIKTGKLDKKYSTIIKKAFEERTEADYGEAMEFSKEQVEKLYNEMIDLTSSIKKLISE